MLFKKEEHYDSSFGAMKSTLDKMLLSAEWLEPDKVEEFKNVKERLIDYERRLQEAIKAMVARPVNRDKIVFFIVSSFK